MRDDALGTGRSDARPMRDVSAFIAWVVARVPHR
jgi:hypothetical protein